jgi:hypothetical protein
LSSSRRPSRDRAANQAAAQAAEDAFLAPLEPAERDALRAFLRPLVTAAAR